MEVSCYIVVAVYVCLFYQSLSSFSFSNTFYFEIYAVGIPSLIKLHFFSIWNHVSVKKKKKKIADDFTVSIRSVWPCLYGTGSFVCSCQVFDVSMSGS